MKGLLADAHMVGDVEVLVRGMQSDYWIEYWKHLKLALYHFEDVGLTPTSRDLQIWQCCQAEQLVLITNNRNSDDDDSLEVAICKYNTVQSLPVFTIGDLGRFQRSRSYADDVIERLYDYLLDIDRMRGAGRLYLP